MANYNLAQRLLFDTVRTLAFGAIGAGYTAIGAATSFPARQFMIQNLTNGNLMFSTDGVNDMFPLAAGISWINDSTSNAVAKAGGFYLADGTILYVKQLGGAPSSGSVYFTIIYGGQ